MNFLYQHGHLAGAQGVLASFQARLGAGPTSERAAGALPPESSTRRGSEPHVGDSRHTSKRPWHSSETLQHTTHM